MLHLKQFSRKDIQKEYTFFQQFKSENGFENPYYNLDYAKFKTDAVKERLNSHRGITKDCLVPDTFYFLYHDEKIVGLFKLRHHLNSFLEEGPGHIGYFILKEYRNRGFATIGLRLLIDKIKSNHLIKEDEIYFEVNRNNIASLRVIKKSGAYFHHITKDKIYARISLVNNEHLYPILDHNHGGEVMINPVKTISMPKKLIIIFFREVIDRLIKENAIKLYFVNNGETPLEVYKFVDEDICITCGIVGAPATAGHLDDILVNGAKDVVFVGGAGSLISTNVGEIMLVSGAFRDEGFSYHYLPPSDIVYSDNKLIKKASEYLKKKNIDHHIGLTWTTDAFYREFKSEVNYYKSRGAKTVEMEQAGLISLAIIRKIKYLGLLYFGDDLSKKQWSSRDWNSKVDSRLFLTYLAKDLVKIL